jgi:uncharacterized integral membrane protein
MSDASTSGGPTDPARPGDSTGGSTGGSSGSASGPSSPGSSRPAPPSGAPGDADRAGRRREEAAETEAAARPPTPITQQIGRGVVVLLAIAFGVFAVANSQPVEFSWLFGETRVVFDAQGQRVSGGVPLIVLMVASLAIGIAVGAAWVGLVARSRRRRD